METEKIKKTTRELVLKMDRDEIMDFLIQCQSHFAIELPSGREKEIWNNHSDFHTTDKLRGLALELT